jgi:hypothetical protein
MISPWARKSVFLEYYAYALGADPKSVISGKFDVTGIAYA